MKRKQSGQEALTNDVRTTLAAVLGGSGSIRTVTGCSSIKRLTLQHSAVREDKSQIQEKTHVAYRQRRTEADEALDQSQEAVLNKTGEDSIRMGGELTGHTLPAPPPRRRSARPRLR